MSFSPTPFIAPKWLSNAHLQTILPRAIKQPTPKYKRELHLDSTAQTAVAYDFVLSHDDTTKPLVVMFHGLEGSSQSPYAKAFANYAKAHGINAVIVHYRGCGGVANQSNQDYNAGDTAEIHHVLSRLGSIYPNVFAVGISIGGNMLAKYLGDYGDKAMCQAGVVVSAPVDMPSSARAMHRFVARHVYTRYLLNSLLKKAGSRIDKEQLKHIKTLDAFDDMDTAPRNGYTSSDEYYRKTSALPTLKNITRPTLIISSEDDPFLGIIARQKDISPSVQLLYSSHGGHVGFISQMHGKLTLDWLPKTIFEFVAWVQKDKL